MPPMSGMVMGLDVVVMINRPEATEDLMLHKNKYFDKHPQSQLVLKRAAGESIVFAKSDMLW